MDKASRIKRLKFRAWHRGTREADYMIGCFFDRYGTEWDEAGLLWFEKLLDEEDVDIIGWALGSLAVPPEYAGAQMDAFCKLDFVDIPR
ncbi:succinate dehydrogenase assembly factor 2 [Novosphingobium sp.]|uniref:FAD assembly factor SdhE n=1 Tax=Novosphingobium sp. TaxID=1874826 RepID=UPI0025F268A7|nr:succinate dehydrogenase assembly factor 2 [Novosphingobium sp.]